ncbi:MAG: HD domain-containing phosphohydrolase [Thermodesulfovibrionia bacterium]
MVFVELVVQRLVGRDFFDKIRRTVKASYFIASIFPLLLLVYIFLKYIYPHSIQAQADIELLILIAVLLSIGGLFLSTRATNKAISSLQSVHTKLNSIVEISGQLGQTRHLDLLLENIVKAAQDIISAETASLLLTDESDNLRVKVVLGERGQNSKDRVVKRGEGISGWVAETGKSAVINDVTQDSRYNPSFDGESGFKTRSVMCVPLTYDKKIIGAIEVLNKKGGIFVKEDEELLWTFAKQASISIVQSKAQENRRNDIVYITEILVGAQDFHSPEKKGHVRRVAKYANLIGRKMGMAESDLKNLYYASLLHDIGLLKIEVSNVNESEPWKKEKYIQHPKLGYDMIRPIFLWKEAAEFVLNHHERYDGAGYLSGKKGAEIPLGAKILFVSETFDVITSKSSYRKRLDFKEALIEIEANSGTQFDPEVVRAFKEAVKDSDLIND